VAIPVAILLAAICPKNDRFCDPLQKLERLSLPADAPMALGNMRANGVQTRNGGANHFVVFWRLFDLEEAFCVRFRRDELPSIG
jgi:hypothetical protein